MNHPTSEEIWGPGDWWQQRKIKRKISKHLGQYGHYLPGGNRSSKHDENVEKIFGTQTIPAISWILPFVNSAVIYGLGVFLVKVIWGSWFFALVWPVCLFFQILIKIIQILTKII